MPTVRTFKERVSDLFAGAMAHLRLHFLYHYYEAEKNRVVYVTREFLKSELGEQAKEPHEYMEKCSWRSIVKDYLEDYRDGKDAVEVPIGRVNDLEGKHV